MRKLLHAWVCILIACNVNSQDFRRVLDISHANGHSFPGNLTNVNGTLFFAADDGVHGRELWKSDGTAAGTVMIEDICPGTASSGPYNFLKLNSGILYFSANDGVHGYELWRSDGTAAGTYMVRDISVGETGSSPYHLTGFNDLVIFIAQTGLGMELWKSNGTSAGTTLVKDINPGAAGSFPSWFAILGGFLYFSAKDADHGAELWRTDGTNAGTLLVTDIYPGSTGSSPIWLENIAGTLYFRAAHPTEGETLMKSGGTSATTVVVKPGAGVDIQQSFENIGSTIYFVSHQDQLWKSDGTSAGTNLVRTITPGALTTNINQLTPAFGKMFFVANDGVHGYELWKSDGTAAGTVMVEDIFPGLTGSNIQSMENINGTIYFAADNEYARGLLWRSDGTHEGTRPIHRFNYGASGDPENFTLVGTRFFLSANEIDYGYELFVADLTVSIPGFKSAMGSAPEPISVQLYPNPATKTAMISVNATIAEKLTCSVVGVAGETIQQKTFTAIKGGNTFKLDISSLPAGIYTVVLRGATLHEQVKFVKQ